MKRCNMCKNEKEELYKYEGEPLCIKCLMKRLIGEGKIIENTVYTIPYGSFLGCSEDNSIYEILNNYMEEIKDNEIEIVVDIDKFE